MKIDIELAAYFVSMFMREKESKSCLSFLVNSPVPKSILLSTYKTFLKDEVFVPIELLVVEEKIKLVEKCRETKLKFNNERLTDAARILYTINFINGNS